jgi:hypothetical protein
MLRTRLRESVRTLAQVGANWISRFAARNKGRSPRKGISVAIYANWDVGSAIRYLTPGGAGAWGPVYFADGATVSNPDFALILNSPNEQVVDVTLPPERVWFASGEPPEFKQFQVGQGRGTVVLTCDDSVARNPPPERDIVLHPPILPAWHVRRTIDQLAAIHPFPKHKALSWVTSNKDALPGHKLRMRLLRAIRDKVPFDLYGQGFRPIDDKWEGIAPYRYSIAFENARAPHYFTEKIMDCFVCLTLPLYYGCPEIQRYFPAKSFIAFDPGDPDVAEEINAIIASDLWKERQDALQEAKWLVLYKYNMFSQLSRLMLERLRPATAPQAIRIQRVGYEHG